MVVKDMFKKGSNKCVELIRADFLVNSNMLLWEYLLPSTLYTTFSI